jgi:hypothetical protein
MVELTIQNNKVEFRGQWFDIVSSKLDGGYCLVNLVNQDNDLIVSFGGNETTINGILQTSAQMIFDTLSSDGQS